MTNAMGRRPEGPGNDEVLYDGPCQFDSDREVTLYRDGTIEIIDHYSGLFVAVTVPDGVLHPPVAAPEPDWSSAPEWAMWWAVAPDGRSQGYFESEPHASWHQSTRSAGWLSWSAELWMECRLPIGVDWRTTLRKRPEVQSE